MPGWAKVVLAFAAVIYGATIGMVLATFGDVARYVRAKPPNIAARRDIRERGLALLRALHDSGLYGRVILVGHSLGSIICYDLIKLFWSERDRARTMRDGDPLHRACVRCQAAAAALEAAGRDEIDEHRKAYRANQWEVFCAMQDRGTADEGWLISDFVTVGSPLAHAQFLMARNAESLKVGVAERRFPASPPVTEGRNGFLYRPDPSEPDVWSAHHAAPFAAVRWTNICDPPRLLIFGDPISGPVAGNFGPGVSDIKVAIRRSRSIAPARLFTHSCYWLNAGPQAPQLDALRSALDLLLVRSPPPWMQNAEPN